MLTQLNLKILKQLRKRIKVWSQAFTLWIGKFYKFPGSKYVVLDTVQNLRTVFYAFQNKFLNQAFVFFQSLHHDIVILLAALICLKVRGRWGEHAAIFPWKRARGLEALHKCRNYDVLSAIKGLHLIAYLNYKWNPPFNYTVRPLGIDIKYA